MNKLLPGSVEHIGQGADCMEENHAAFHNALKSCGIPDKDIFQTDDLFEAKNIKQVVKCLTALGRVMADKADYMGPLMASKVSSGHLNTESSAVCQGTSKLQIGSGKGTSQVNINIGKEQLIQD